MIIIVEGNDKTGKSTLCQRLIDKYKLIKIKTNAPTTSDPFEEYLKVIEGLNPSKNYIFDRFYLGERVYGPIYRGKSGLSKTQQFYIESLLKRFESVLVLCYDLKDRIRQRYIDLNETESKVQDIDKINNLFNEAYDDSILPKTKYCFWYDQTHLFCDHPLFSRPKAMKIDRSYAGESNPDFLFIGDEFNYNVKNKNKALTIFNSPSGMFLFKALKFLETNKLSFGLINSVEYGRIIDKKTVEIINPSKIICLGANAYLRCVDKFDVVKVPHPQFAKRFFGPNALKRYIDCLKEACL